MPLENAALRYHREPRPGKTEVVPTKPFFSQDDRALHRAVFQGAFNVALLVSDLGDDLSVDLFGWRGGEIAQRGFYLLPDSYS